MRARKPQPLAARQEAMAGARPYWPRTPHRRWQQATARRTLPRLAAVVAAPAGQAESVVLSLLPWRPQPQRAAYLPSVGEAAEWARPVESAAPVLHCFGQALARPDEKSGAPDDPVMRLDLAALSRLRPEERTESPYLEAEYEAVFGQH